MAKFKRTKPGNLLKGLATPPPKAKEEKYLHFSFKDFDRNQGGTFNQWEIDGILAIACEALNNFSTLKVPECFSRRFKIYGEFPPKSKFNKPKHVIPDARWASMHVQGRQCLGGHIIDNVFYIVFLDHEHHLWPSEKKHT